MQSNSILSEEDSAFRIYSNSYGYQSHDREQDWHCRERHGQIEDSLGKQRTFLPRNRLKTQKRNIVDLRQANSSRFKVVNVHHETKAYSLLLAGVDNCLDIAQH